MSSRLHQDKSLEELQPVVEAFIANYRKLFGKSPDRKIVLAKLDQYKTAKEAQLYDELFSQLSPKNISDVQNLVENSLKQSFFDKSRKV